MDIKDFVKTILLQLNEAVDEVREQTSRDIKFVSTDGKRTVEFDIAVTAEDVQKATGKAGVKVLSIIEGSGDIAKESKNSSVSRVQFGLQIDSRTKEEAARNHAAVLARNSRQISSFM